MLYHKKGFSLKQFFKHGKYNIFLSIKQHEYLKLILKNYGKQFSFKNNESYNLL